MGGRSGGDETFILTSDYLNPDELILRASGTADTAPPLAAVVSVFLFAQRARGAMMIWHQPSFMRVI